MEHSIVAMERSIVAVEHSIVAMERSHFTIYGFIKTKEYAVNDCPLLMIAERIPQEFANKQRKGLASH